jgi:tetratricopeptide (TPR) repeat protein
MSEFKPRILSEEKAIEQIVATVQQAEEGSAPFALVLGSGFSHGLVPTARELVSDSLPLWIQSLKSKKSFDAQQKEISADQRAEIARAFWSGFVKQNSDQLLVLPLDSQTGLPESYSDAYRAVFTPGYFGAVGAPAQARKFQRALMRLDKPRLNAAHFLLASLLGVQPGKSRRSDLFNADAAFSRLILTTNFDPFLQTALQAVNRLYFMSDTPELGVGDEIYDDQIDSVHLVYLHGTIHRRSQAATEQSITKLKEKNAQRLAPALKRHGVIVLGYSGWDDAIVEALAACDDFDHLLYWCGLESDPLGKGIFGPRVAEILGKSSAFYVQITGAGRFMAQLVGKLVKGLPRLLDNPIAQLREMLATIDLGELKDFTGDQPRVSTTAPLSAGGSNTETFVKAWELALSKLLDAEQIFRVQPVAQATDKTTDELASAPSKQDRDQPSGAPPIDSKKQIQQLLSSARVAAALGNHLETLKLCDEALSLASLEPADRANVLLTQGVAHYFLGDHDQAISSWSQIAELPGAPVEHVAVALRNRGVTWGEKGETQKALADYTRLIEQLPGAPVEEVAAALRNRGVTWGRKGETQKELADYTRLIEQLPGAPVGELAVALRNRGVVWGQKGETQKALADYTRVIEQLPGAPVEEVAVALRNRGVTWGEKGETQKALADYTRLIEQLPGAPVEEVAVALRNRGVIWGRKGETEKALADYTHVIDQLPGAPLEEIAGALANRGWTRYLKDDFSAFLADTEAALTKVSSLDFAAFNRGLALLAVGRDTEALQAYRHAGERFPQVIDTLGLADLEEAKKKWLSDARAQPAIQLLHSLKS